MVNENLKYDDLQEIGNKVNLKNLESLLNLLDI